MLNEKLRLGFGCMRLPMQGETVDLAAFSQMVDAYLAAGGRYFDTAHNYIGGQSETAIRAGLTSRYPREAYILTNKLTRLYLKQPEDVRAVLEKQLAACGVDYFDYYLSHAIRRDNYADIFLKCHAFEQLVALKEEGKIRHIGISYHDDPEFLDHVLTQQPAIEVVQLQFNYADYDNPDVQSWACYQVCVRHNKPVLVMEPVKGGRLAELPPEAQRLLGVPEKGSCASFALRYAASAPQVAMVLSGMSTLEQMQENLRTMCSFQPFTAAEYTAVARVRALLRKQEQIACTACHYCTDVCPQQIAIPALLHAWNARKLLEPWTPVQTPAPSCCLDCGACEANCPQHLSIRSLLKRMACVVK